MQFPNGLTPLHVASMQGYTDIVQRLIDAGAPLNAQTMFESATALRFAVQSSHVDVVEILLKAGADRKILNHVPMTIKIPMDSRFLTALIGPVESVLGNSFETQGVT